jgi:ribose 5-phosphate isomerase RpiB
VFVWSKKEENNKNALCIYHKKGMKAEAERIILFVVTEVYR